MNTIPPNDWTYFEMLNEIVQQEPATSLDPELMGPIEMVLLPWLVLDELSVRDRL
jgi:hypothetical protein